MSKLAEFRNIERQLQELLRRQDELKHSEDLKKDIEFGELVNALMEEYGKTPRQVIEIIAPDLLTQAPAVTRVRRPRQTKIYVNPHNGEEIATKGGHHKVLKEWKAQYGADEVESWVRS